MNSRNLLGAVIMGGLAGSFVLAAWPSNAPRAKAQAPLADSVKNPQHCGPEYLPRQVDVNMMCDTASAVPTGAVLTFPINVAGIERSFSLTLKFGHTNRDGQPQPDRICGYPEGKETCVEVADLKNPADRKVFYDAQVCLSSRMQGSDCLKQAFSPN
jgi:hypothetical protein